MLTRIYTATTLLAIALTGASEAAAQTFMFAHPGSLHTAGDLNSSLSFASQGEQPWVAGRDALVARVEDPSTGVLLNYVIEAPFDKIYTSANMNSLLHDADVAHTCALYWYTFKNTAGRSTNATACRSLARNIISAWVGVSVEEDLQFLFCLPGLLLTADLLGGASDIPGFHDWLAEVAVPTAEDTYYGNQESEVWAPRGQNQGAWALYNLLLVSHLFQDQGLFHQYAALVTAFARRAVDVGDTTEFRFGWRYNDASMGNERVRGASGIRYTFISLMPLLASAKVIRNVTGVDTLDFIPDAYDVNGDAGTRLWRAVQNAFYYINHQDRWPYNSSASPLLDFEHAPVLLDGAAAIYRISEYAAFAKPWRPFHYDSSQDLNIFRFADPHATYLRSAAAREIDESAPGTQTFEAGPGPFAVRNGSWATAVEPGSPSGNKIYQQIGWTSAATATVGDMNWLDYELRARVKLRSKEGAASAVGLFARYQDSNNYYSFMWNASDSKLRVEKRFNGVQSVLASVPFALQLGSWYTFHMRADGPTVRCWIENAAGAVTSLSVVDKFQSATRHAFLAGKVGLQAHRAEASFENVCIERNGSSCADAETFLPPSLVMATL